MALANPKEEGEESLRYHYDVEHAEFDQQRLTGSGPDRRRLCLCRWGWLRWKLYVGGGWKLRQGGQKSSPAPTAVHKM